MFDRSVIQTMDAVKLNIVTNSMFECSLCLQVYKDPRLLPCGHTFCLQCIQKTNNKPCSLCKKEWPLPANGLQGLQKNAVAEKLIQSLSSISHCAAAGNDSHGQIKYLCIDCWDPLCEKCAKNHTQFSRVLKNHVVKKMNEVDQSDVELNYQRKALLCAQHKDKLMELLCTHCDQFICHKCYISSHNSHECVSAEYADAKLKLQIDQLKINVQENVNKIDGKVKLLKSVKLSLETSKANQLQYIKILLDDVKKQLRVEHDKIISKIDECFKNAVKSIDEKTHAKNKELEQEVQANEAKLQSLQEAMSSIEQYTTPLSTAVERATLLKEDSIGQIMKTAKFTPHYQSHWLIQEPIIEWKTSIDDWLLSYKNTLSFFQNVPQLDVEHLMKTQSNFMPVKVI